MHQVNALVVGNGELGIFLRHVKIADQTECFCFFFAGRVFALQNLFKNCACFREATAFLKEFGFRQHCWGKKCASKILPLEAVEPLQSGFLVALLHLHFSECGEDAVLLHRPGIPTQSIAQHLFAFSGLAGFQQGISKIHKQCGVVFADIGQGACLDQKRPGSRGVGFFERLCLCVEEAQAKGVLFLMAGLACHVVQKSEVFGGFGWTSVKTREGGEEIIHRADFGVIAEISNRLPIDFARLFGFLLLPVIPAQVGDGLGNSR